MSAYLEKLENKQRCNKWKLVVSIGSGKDRRRFSKVFAGSTREATKALKEYEREIELVPAHSTTLEGFAYPWNEARLKSGIIKASTAEKYEWHLRVLCPLLPMPLERIRPSDILKAYATLKDTRHYTGTSLRAVHNSLTRIFRAAVDDGIIATSPMQGVDAPRIDTTKKRALSPEEAKRVLSLLDIQDNRAFAVSLILRCGLRRSEVLALEWQDVDSAVHIHHTKSEAGVRDIPLDSETLEMIAIRRAIVESTLAFAEETLSPQDSLCCDEWAHPLTVNSLRKWWERHRKEFGLDTWTLHELRHTFLTNLAQANVHPAIMQKLAGHSSINTTLKIYTHVHAKDLEDAMGKLAEVRQSAPRSAPSFPHFENRFSDVPSDLG